MSAIVGDGAYAVQTVWRQVDGGVETRFSRVRVSGLAPVPTQTKEKKSLSAYKQAASWLQLSPLKTVAYAGYGVFVSTLYALQYTKHHEADLHLAAVITATGLLLKRVPAVDGDVLAPIRDIAVNLLTVTGAALAATQAIELLTEHAWLGPITVAATPLALYASARAAQAILCRQF